MNDHAAPAFIDALYFDGRSARAQPVQLQLQGGMLLAQASPANDSDAPRQWPLADVQWPEFTRHGARVLHLRGGGSLQAVDARAFDAWRGEQGLSDSWVVRAQQNWRWSVACALLLLALVGTGWRWGVPAAASGVMAVLPLRADEAVGKVALKSINERWLVPSFVPAARQAELRGAFASMLAADRAAHPAEPELPWRLQFAGAHPAIGPNAFALPGGCIVLTDAMVDLLAGQDDTLLGVLAHEMGHVRHRHGMRGLVQASLVGAAASLLVGDFSSLLAGVPTVMVQMGYSRDAERQADAFAARLLLASGRSPKVMLTLFERLKPLHDKLPALPIALASHPADEERMRFFREATK